MFGVKHNQLPADTNAVVTDFLLCPMRKDKLGIKKVVRCPTTFQYSATTLSRSRQVEAVKVHHLVPSRHEVVHELLFRIRTRVNLSQGAKL